MGTFLDIGVQVLENELKIPTLNRMNGQFLCTEKLDIQVLQFGTLGKKDFFLPIFFYENIHKIIHFSIRFYQFNFEAVQRKKRNKKFRQSFQCHIAKKHIISKNHFKYRAFTFLMFLLSWKRTLRESKILAIMIKIMVFRFLEFRIQNFSKGQHVHQQRTTVNLAQKLDHLNKYITYNFFPRQRTQLDIIL